jgi:beta-mannosidase
VKLQVPKSFSVTVEKDCVCVAAELPVKGLAIDTKKEGVVFEDNLVDLVPGETVRIAAKGIKEGDKVNVRHLH